MTLANIAEDRAAHQANGVNGEWTYIKKHGFERTPLKIAIAGAGAAGICLAIKILQAQKSGRLGPVDTLVFERAEGDIPSHVYQFAFAPYADWPEYYSSSKDINRYMHIVAQKFGVESWIKVNHTVVSAIYEQDRAKWVLQVQEKGQAVKTVEVDIYIPATGVLSQVNRPNIPGMENFESSKILHTAEWPPNLDFKTAFKDENVAVIGIGSSGLQTVGAITPYTKNVSVFARSKFWISPPLVAEPAGQRKWKGGNFFYSEEEKAQFRKNSKALYKHGSELSAATMHVFDVFFKGSEKQESIKKEVRQTMEQELRDPDLIAKLVPDFDVWCRRVTPCVPFMEAIHQPHVELVTDHIQKITKDGIITKNDRFIKVDRIIYATGFDTTFKPKYPFKGRDGKDLGEVWAKRPKANLHKPHPAYMSLAVADFPNMFFMCGPGTVFANGSLLAGIEVNANYIVDAVAKLQSQDILSMEISQDAQDEYNAQQDTLMKDLVFTSSCSSWYKGGQPDAPPDALFAGSTLQFMEMLSVPRWEDWKFKYRHGNRFSFLGQGTSSVEAQDGDRAYYLSEEVHKDPLRITDLRPPMNGAVPLNL
ncbi:hypothetical protein QFC24_006658 [Naganishia onofrii]|uniref:Uncharacterized protein n=1 Tax=Naganishia onofrii TaxID=1851511 RepID=A0ACC2WYP8_9TREE|nr:hypothetical protein QFC24_006658 [Naganishia onofrii]